MSERILCAAIWYKAIGRERTLVLDEIADSVQPANIDFGIVLCGFRHNHIISQCFALTGLRQAEIGEYQQGFLTSSNRFVDRKEGAEIHILSGGSCANNNRLDSSDLY